MPTITLREYGRPTSLKTLSNDVGLSETQLLKELRKVQNELKTIFPAGQFIEYVGLSKVRFADVAGVVSFGSGSRVEIIPKFLSGSNTEWREDFLKFSLLSRYGHIISTRRTSSGAPNANDLFEVVAGTWLEEFELNQRSLIRNYRKSHWVDFMLDAEFEEEEIALPESSGIRQTGLQLSTANRYNETLLNAARVLRSKCTNPITLMRLQRAAGILFAKTKDKVDRRTKQTALSRESRWLPILEISDIILMNQSLGFSASGKNLLPSYLIGTSESWERLIRLAVKKAFGEYVVAKSQYLIGERIKTGTSIRQFSTPDISVSQVGTVNYLLDAKYKVASANGAVISSSDIYESYCFMKAARVNSIILVYPIDSAIDNDPLENQPLETFKFTDGVVYAIGIGCNGIAKPKAFSKLCSNIKKVVEAVGHNES